jgi:hypothetical protein
MAKRTLGGMLRGDAPIARHVFHDERKRRLVRLLQEEGWPIYGVAGKRSAFPDDLDRMMGKTLTRRRIAAT